MSDACCASERRVYAPRGAMKHVRNALIVALLALAVWAVPGGGTAATTFGAAMFVLITVFLGLIAVRTYRERRLSLYSLGDRHRALLYAALGLAVLTMAAGPRLFATGLGAIAWFVLMGLAASGLYAVWRHSRQY